MTDIKIAQRAALRPIGEIAKKIGLNAEEFEPYGRYIAKVEPRCFKERPSCAKLVLVTAMTPTPAGEGKTTVSVGLADGMNFIGKRAMLALREPSLGPVFGMKGGATGGGYSQVLPMENINLHFTGDLHAITAANNLLAAMTDNSIQQGNPLQIDPRQVVFRRCMDVNDRQLRRIVSGLGGKMSGMPREDGFDITAASEVMAVFCLADGLDDLKKRLARIIVARRFDGTPVTCGDLGAQGAMAVLLRDSLKPNLVQTIEGTPCLIHGGPFANIAHGCNSVTATQLACKLSDYVVTEAGFGADLGAEKFVDVKCRMSGLRPDCVVMVATVRALKWHGGVSRDALKEKNVEAMLKGLPNLLRHVNNVREVWNLPVLVAVNRFTTDTDAEISALSDALNALEIQNRVCEAWAKGGAGAAALAKAVCDLADSEHSDLHFTYSDDLPLHEKIRAVARKIYHANDAVFASGVREQLKTLENEGFTKCPVCIAKTQYSFSDDAKKLNAPENFDITIRSVRVSAGAGFVVAFAGDIIAMPGLPKKPAALQIDVDADGVITGLF